MYIPINNVWQLNERHYGALQGLDKQETVKKYGKDQVNVLTFFITIRKDPQIRAINSALARDPQGYSRIPRETFQEVFDRMEREIIQK